MIKVIKFSQKGVGDYHDVIKEANEWIEQHQDIEVIQTNYTDTGGYTTFILTYKENT
jgi:hypothetical protein